MKTGRYGAYVQLGENDDEPKMKSLLPGMEMDSTTLEEALRLLRLPRKVGVDENGEEVFADYGRYGPYVKRGLDTRSLEKPEEIFELTLEAALERLAQAPAHSRRRASTVLKELGEDPAGDRTIKLLSGPYGLYVSDGSTNASLPKGAEPEKVTLAEALELIRAREEAGPSRRKKKVRRKKAAKKKAAKRTAKKTSKKSSKKKAAKKKTAG